MDDFERELQDRIDDVDKAGYDLERAIINLRETGASSAVPPIFGALMQLRLIGTHDNSDERLERAYEYVTSDK